MGIRSASKWFISTVFKSFNPKYYYELGDRPLRKSIEYFLTLLFFAFVVMTLIAIPKLMIIQSQFESDSINIIDFKINAVFQTREPVSIPREKPVISFDTTGNKTLEKEMFLINNNKIDYNILGKNGSFELGAYDFVKNKSSSTKSMLLLGIFLIPSLLAFYYLVYLLKYLIIIIPLALLSYVFAKVVRNQISLKQSIALAFYTSTVMVLFEILIIPFAFKEYLFVYTPFVGVNFAIAALTLFFTLYVISIRLNGNRYIRR